ncbi:polyprenyl synthetase family protein [Nocardia sp. NPDC088792]|uniref:polyprenyl synthetase family protein n=1 Tax=Nocardia sp. NPDC088792 TaxID=3364332 RepID=UPI00382249B0
MAVAVTTHASSIRVGSAAGILADACRVTEPVVRESVALLPDPLRRMAGYHLGWWDQAGTAGAAGGAGSGKMQRAALTIAAAGACGGDTGVAVPAAAAVELLHNFTLVQDDVMDADPLRRGRTTVWRVWGNTAAILLGDALHALALQVLATRLPPAVAVDAVARMESAAIELAHAQHEDCAFETHDRVSVLEYLAMASGKTGALMGCACALGALCVGAAEDTISAMDRFGRELGVAFQCADDLLGIWGDPAVTGKPVGSDLVRRKWTLPVAAAVESGGGTAAELAELYRSPGPLTGSEVARARALIEAAGGRQLTRRWAEQRSAAALQALPEHARTGDLAALARIAVHRNR